MYFAPSGVVSLLLRMQGLEDTVSSRGIPTRCSHESVVAVNLIPWHLCPSLIFIHLGVPWDFSNKVLSWFGFAWKQILR